MDPDPRVDSFLHFLSNNSIYLDTSRIRLVASPVHGFGFQSLTHIPLSSVLASIPKHAVLSVETLSLWANFESPPDPVSEFLLSSSSTSKNSSRPTTTAPPTTNTTAAAATGGITTTTAANNNFTNQQQKTSEKTTIKISPLLQQREDDTTRHKTRVSARDKYCDPVFQLPAAILFETLLGEKSPWAPYLDLLPRTLSEIGVPLAEPSQSIARLFQGTGVDTLTTKMRKKLFTVFHLKIRNLFLCRAKELGILNASVRKVSFDDFVLAFVWVTSRAFHVDPFHRDSMVPIADLFNHRTDGEHVHVEGTSTSSSDTDEDEEDEDDSDVEIIYENEESENGEDQNNSSVQESNQDEEEDNVDQSENNNQGYFSDNDDQPQLHNSDNNTEDNNNGQRKESGNQTLAEAARNVITTTANNQNEPGTAETDVDGGEVDSLNIVCMREVQTGEEIFNTFGQKSNTLLYLNYGFIEPNNAYDTALIHKDDVSAIAMEIAENLDDIGDTRHQAGSDTKGKCEKREDFGEKEKNRRKKNKRSLDSVRDGRRWCINKCECVTHQEVIDDFFQVASDGSFCHGIILLFYLHFVPWTLISHLAGDEFDLLEHMSDLSVRDMVRAVPNQMSRAIRLLLRLHDSKFPSSTSLESDELLLSQWLSSTSTVSTPNSNNDMIAPTNSNANSNSDSGNNQASTTTTAAAAAVGVSTGSSSVSTCSRQQISSATTMSRLESIALQLRVGQRRAMQTACEKVLGVLDVTDEEHCPSSFSSSSDDGNDEIEVEHPKRKRRKIGGDQSCNNEETHLNRDLPQGEATSN